MSTRQCYLWALGNEAHSITPDALRERQRNEGKLSSSGYYLSQRSTKGELRPAAASDEEDCGQRTKRIAGILEGAYELCHSYVPPVANQERTVQRWNQTPLSASN